MALRNIVHEGDPILKRVCRPVTNYDERLHVLLDDMRETLLEESGVGLAAPQVGVARRAVIVMDTNQEALPPEEQIIELINPEIIAVEGEQDGPEGCLSVPGVFGLVKRPEKVTVRAFDRNGKQFTVSGVGLTARAMCHELDHLEGRLFLELTTHILTDEELEKLTGEEA